MLQDTGQRAWEAVRAFYSLPARPEILGIGNLAMGLIGVMEAPTRSSGPAYAVIRDWAPIGTWAAIQLVIGATLLVGVLLLRGHVQPQIGQLVQSLAAALGAVWCTAWATTLLLVAMADPHVSYRGSALWLFWGVVPHMYLTFGREG